MQREIQLPGRPLVHHDGSAFTSFSTEFSVRPLASSAAFLAQVITWLRGTKYSTVLDDASEKDLDAEAPIVRAPSGEELRLRVLSSGDGSGAIGFRHDFPDQEGRIWRTEAVLRKGVAKDGQDLIRLRTQCIAQRAGARLETPKKPYLLKAILKDSWGGEDGSLNVSDQPIWLNDDAPSEEIARKITDGSASQYLPVLYISAIGHGRWALSAADIGHLAFQLGGVAHVVAEPDRAFSYRLRDASRGQNVYSGTIGLSVPGRGISRKLYLGGQLADPKALQQAAQELSTIVRTHMPAEGWDWTELQEQALRSQRERNRARLSQQETEELYEAEIAALRDQIGQLKEQIAQSSLADTATSDEELRLSDVAAQLGPEIYPGELQDRLRAAAKIVEEHADKYGLDTRSRAVLSAVVSLPVSEGLGELLEDLKRATKDPNRMADQVGQLLGRHGYREKSRNRHLRLEAQAGFKGLDAITVPTTPSDSRGLTNMRKQIERTLGLTQLGT